MKLGSVLVGGGGGWGSEPPQPVDTHPQAAPRMTARNFLLIWISSGKAHARRRTARRVYHGDGAWRRRTGPRRLDWWPTAGPEEPWSDAPRMCSAALSLADPFSHGACAHGEYQGLLRYLDWLRARGPHRLRALLR